MQYESAADADAHGLACTVVAINRSVPQGQPGAGRLGQVTGGVITGLRRFGFTTSARKVVVVAVDAEVAVLAVAVTVRADSC